MEAYEPIDRVRQIGTVVGITLSAVIYGLPSGRSSTTTSIEAVP